MAIKRGAVVRARTASGRMVTMRALSGPVAGMDFEVVWVATEVEWARATGAGEEPDGLPWPSDAVHEMIRAA